MSIKNKEIEYSKATKKKLLSNLNMIELKERREYERKMYPYFKKLEGSCYVKSHSEFNTFTKLNKGLNTYTKLISINKKEILPPNGYNKKSDCQYKVLRIKQYFNNNRPSSMCIEFNDSEFLSDCGERITKKEFSDKLNKVREEIEKYSGI